MFWNTTEARIKKTVETLFRRVLEDAETTLGKIQTITDLNTRVTDLQMSLVELEIQKDRKDEDFAKREREIEHKVGLERTRQKFEVENSKREATVTVREENLTADRNRFEEQMKFQQERFTEEVKYLKDMVGQVLKRLPSAEIYTEVKGG